MELLRPQRFESNFVALVRSNGTPISGYRTYQVPSTSGRRDTILLNFEASWLFANREEKQRFDNFKQSLKGASTGRFARAKEFVNALYDGDIVLENVGIFIHKHGLVPAFVLSERADGLQVALYPNFINSSSVGLSDHRPGFMASNLEFLCSLEIAFETQMRRYLEDVAEDFLDIQENLSFSQTLKRAKDAEKTLAASVKPKIDRLLPGNVDYATKMGLRRFDDNIQETQHQILMSNFDAVVWAQYARYVALYMINELYSLLGIAHRAEIYLSRLKKLKAIVTAVQDDPGWYEAQFENHAILNLLRSAARGYYSDQLDSIENLRSDEPWVQSFVDFAAFLLRAKRHSLPPETGRIFLSHQHGNPHSELLANQIRKWGEGAGNGRVKMLSYRGVPGAAIRDPIKALIWSADEVISLLPAQTAPAVSGEKKNLDWIILEAEHATLLEKPLVFMADNQTEVDRLALELGNFNGELLGGNTLRTRKERLEEVREAVKNRIVHQLRSDPSTGEELDAESQRFLTRLTSEILARRAIDRIHGFLQLIPEEQSKCVVRLYEIAPFPMQMSKERIASELRLHWPNDYVSEKDAERIFAASWTALRHRTGRSDKEGRYLIVKGKPCFLIRQIRSGKYTSNLFPTVQASLEAAGKAEIKEAIAKIKSRIEGQDRF